MKFKSDEVKKRWDESIKHPKLLPLLVDVQGFYEHLYHKEPVMTEASRTREETIAIYKDKAAPMSPHEMIPLRAFDMRSSILSEAENKQLEGIINKRWEYDASRPDKKCCMYHRVGDNAYHLHFQVCDNTKFYGVKS